MSMITRRYRSLAVAGQRQSQVHVVATVQQKQEPERQDGDQLANEARCLNGDVLERADQVSEELG